MVAQLPGVMHGKNAFQCLQLSPSTMCATAKEIVWMRNVLHHINLSQLAPTLMFCDNKSAIQLAKNPEFHKRTKHISVKYQIASSFQSGRQTVLYLIGPSAFIFPLLSSAFTLTDIRSY